MKKVIIGIVAILVIIAVVFYYNASFNTSDSNDSINISQTDSLLGVVEMEGIVGDGTSMNEMEVINDSGDTIYITIPSELVKGDIKAGDCVNVIYYAKEDENLASTVIDMSDLCHLWSTRNEGTTHSLEFDPKGVVITYNSNVDYCSWELKNGLLVLKKSKHIGSERREEADTFDIMRLTDTQLVLMRNHEETVYELEN